MYLSGKDVIIEPDEVKNSENVKNRQAPKCIF